MHTDSYDDILRLPHPVSQTHIPMSRQHRAAQFAPFAALTGYEDAVGETARTTSRRVETDDAVREELDRRWQCICGRINEATVTVTYFQKDDKKDGGAYLTVTGTIQKIDYIRGCFYMNDGTLIAFSDVLSVDSDVVYGDDV